MACCTPVPPLTYKGGDIASSITDKALRNARMCAVKDAVARATLRAEPARGCRVPATSGGTESSTHLLSACANKVTSTTAAQLLAAPLRGVPESVRIAQIIKDCEVTTANRFAEYAGTFIAPACPPVPTEILNSTLPKPNGTTSICSAQLPFYLR
jgi:hypothetical protein